jgi:hypothetical protein
MAIGLASNWLRAGKPHREVRTVLLHLREKILPAIARACEIPLLHHPAKVCNAAFNRLDTTIASGIEHQLRGAREFSGLRGRQAKIHLEGDPSLRVPSDACGRGDRACLWRERPLELHGVPSSSVACQTPLVARTSACTAAAALHADPCGDGLGDERCIKRLARERRCGKGKGASAARLAAARRT